MFRADFKDLLEYLMEITPDIRKLHGYLRFPVIVTAYEIMLMEV
jgi:hypothetical protein